jgi:hypothetical protein
MYRRIKDMGRGKSQKSLDLIAVAKAILEETQPTTVRSVCYRLFVQGLIKDMSPNETGKVSKQLTWARDAGEIPWEWIVDGARSARYFNSWLNPKDFAESVKRQYRKDRWQHQPYLIEVWSEKSTVEGILQPVLDEYGVTFRICKGFNSTTEARSVAEESRNYRKITALYVGDYDPSGLFMAKHDIYRCIEKYGGDIEPIHLALTAEHIETLPSQSVADKGPRTKADGTKSRGDPRYIWYLEHGHPSRFWELDAMDPNDLRQMVADAIRSYIDWRQWDQDGLAEAAEMSTIDHIFGNWERLRVEGGEQIDTSIEILAQELRAANTKASDGMIHEPLTIEDRQLAHVLSVWRHAHAAQFENGIVDESAYALEAVARGEHDWLGLSCLWSAQQGPFHLRTGYDNLFGSDRPPSAFLGCAKDPPQQVR